MTVAVPVNLFRRLRGDRVAPKVAALPSLSWSDINVNHESLPSSQHTVGLSSQDHLRLCLLICLSSVSTNGLLVRLDGSNSPVQPGCVDTAIDAAQYKGHSCSLREPVPLQYLLMLFTRACNVPVLASQPTTAGPNNIATTDRRAEYLI